MVTRRALWTGESAGMLDRPGGHPEPSNIFDFQDPSVPKIEEIVKSFQKKQDVSKSRKSDVDLKQEQNLTIAFESMNSAVAKEVSYLSLSNEIKIKWKKLNSLQNKFLIQ